MFWDKILDKMADKISIRVRRDLVKEMAWDVFSTLGVDELDRIVNEARANREKVGHSDYVNLGKVYEEHLRGMAIERLDILLKRLTDEPFTTIKKDENPRPKG